MHEETQTGFVLGKAQVVLVKKLTETAVVPTYGSSGAACFDFYADLPEPVVIAPRSFATIPTGIAVSLPNNTVLEMYSRSGHGFKHQIRFVNCVGIIDSDYRGEIKVGLFNDSDAPYTVQPQERIAQGCVLDYTPVTFVETEILPESVRGSGGFGSTGK